MEMGIWETVIGIVAGLGSVVAAFLKFRDARPLQNKRSRLKTDIEILRMLKSTDPEYDTVKEHVAVAIQDIYKKRDEKEGTFKVHNWEYFLLGLIATVGLTTWTVFLVKDVFSWWSLLTGVYAFASLAIFTSSFSAASEGKSLLSSFSATPRGKSISILSSTRSKPGTGNKDSDGN
jgi:hypothetical protein